MPALSLRSCVRLQEYEKRFETWMDNLRFVLDYNAKHTSHWVRPLLAALPLGPPLAGAPCPGLPLVLVLACARC